MPLSSGLLQFDNALRAAQSATLQCNWLAYKWRQSTVKNNSKTTAVTWKVCGQYPAVSLAQPRVARACRAYVVADGMERLGLDSEALYWVMRVATYTGNRHWNVTPLERYSYSRPRIKYLRYCCNDKQTTGIPRMSHGMADIRPLF